MQNLQDLMFGFKTLNIVTVHQKIIFHHNGCYCALHLLQHGLSGGLSAPLCCVLESGPQQSNLLSFRQGLWMVMSHGPYVKLVIGFLFTSLAFMVMLCSIIWLLLDVEIIIECQGIIPHFRKPFICIFFVQSAEYVHSTHVCRVNMTLKEKNQGNCWSSRKANKDVGPSL